MFSRNALTGSSRCSKGFRSLHRTLATEATSSTTPEATRPTKRPPRAELIAAIVLNRSPILTRTPTVFERAFYAYQTRIQRALHNPFPYEFYFKQGSPLEARFNVEERKRERKAFGKPFSLESVSVTEGVALGPQEGEGEVIMSRIHESDNTNDTTSLDRRGQRNLYLVVKKQEGGKDVWRFPQGGVAKGELLHQAAQRDLHAECGEHMDSWIVSRNPIGVYEPPSLESESQARQLTFFFKAHILAGQVKPQDGGITEFAWLTKQEIESKVDKHYWDGVKDMLSDF